MALRLNCAVAPCSKRLRIVPAGPKGWMFRGIDACLERAETLAHN